MHVRDAAHARGTGRTAPACEVRGMPADPPARPDKPAEPVHAQGMPEALIRERRASTHATGRNAMGGGDVSAHP